MMIYQEALELFSKESPVTVMMRGTMENVFSAQRLDRLFGETAVRQYEDELLFSTVADLMGLAVTKVRPSIHAAYQHRKERVNVSIKAVYDKLNGIEPQVCRAMVVQTAGQLGRLIGAMKAELPELLPGYRVRILDGNHLRRTQRRLKELREINSAPLPGQALVVLDPARMLAIDVFPCEDAHAQERSLLAAVLETVREDDLWIADRNFCTIAFLCGIAQRKAHFVIRQHGKLPWRPEGQSKRIGRCATGVVYEQKAVVTDENGREHAFRRITVQLDGPTRDGDMEVHVLTNLPSEISAKTIANLYLQRWTIEAAFGEIATTLRGELDTLAYPKAALFGFCTALAMYNLLSVIKAAIRVTHRVGNDKLSTYYLADEIAATYRGMMIVLPPPAWRERFAELSIGRMAATLIRLAKQVRLSQFRKHPRGPKKPPNAFNKKYRNHVSTKRILDQRIVYS
jgi:NADH:ubiquinone oxidoreductase subunit E